MKTHPYLPLPKRDQDIDKYYAVLGRSLAFCTEFEINCRHLAHHFEVKDSNDYVLEIYLLSKHGTLASKIIQIQKTHNLPSYTVKILEDARTSRNWIAHEAAEYHVHMIQTAETRKAFETDIILRISEVARGNQLVMDMRRSIESDNDVWLSSDIIAYDLAIQEWIAT